MVFLSKSFTGGYAFGYNVSHNWWKISTYSLTTEIFFCAALYYREATFVGKLLSKVGGKIGSAAGKIANSIGNGIDVENKKDTKTVCGIQRWVIYDTFYAICPGIL